MVGTKAHQIRELLDLGVSRKSICEQLCCSEEYVRDIARGRNTDNRTVRTREPERCKTCGGLVQKPCRLCAIAAEVGEG